jgi:phosphoribosylaminoimidazole carboxylase (NCAIR synthetase)
MSNPWPTAAETLNRFVDLDRSMGRRLAELSASQARDAKLSEALEAGRICGLRQEFYEKKHRQLLTKEMARRPHTEPHW